MDRWLFSFMITTASALLWSHLPPLWLLPCCLLVSLYCIVRQEALWLSGCLASILWAASVGHWYTFWQQAVDDNGPEVRVQGRIESIVVDQAEPRLTLRVTHLNRQRVMGPKPALRLSWRYPTHPLQQGQVWSLSARVKPAYGSLNLGGFNYQRWQLSEGIVASGYVQDEPRAEVLVDETTYRQRWVSTLVHSELPAKEWLLALSLGYRGLFDDDDWRVLQRLGLNHLVAISGLHLGIVAGLSYLLVAPILSIAHRRRQQVNSHQWALVISAILTLGYAYIAGMNIPVVRAWLMLTGIVVLTLFAHHWSVGRYLLLCFTLFVMLFPLSIYGVSLWLSFGAIFAIRFVYWRWPSQPIEASWRSAVRNLLKIQLGLSALLLPLVAWQFSLVSFAAPLVNLVAVPIVTIFLVPLCLLALVLMISHVHWGIAFMLPLGTGIEWAVQALELWAESPLAAQNLSGAPGVVWALIAGAMLIAVLPSIPKRPWVIGLLLLPLLTHYLPSRDGSVHVNVLDVGQGLSIVVQHDDHTVVYDTGPEYPSGFNAAQAHLLPLLQYQGINNLTLLILSHLDSDHAGGLAWVKGALPIEALWQPAQQCVAGQAIRLGNMQLDVLWPLEPMSGDENDQSCVVRLSTPSHRVLLTGDISAAQERLLVKAYGQRGLQADIIIAPHHGSDTSSSTALIKTVQPSWGVFSAGYRNQWQFPRAAVVERYHQAGARTLTTANSGQLQFKLSENQPIEVIRWRQDSQPYWYHRDLWSR